MTWETAQDVSATIQHVVASAAVMAGAIWAYFKFVRFRTLKPRLEFAFAWSGLDEDESTGLGVLTVKLTNRGQTKVALRVRNEVSAFLRYSLIGRDHAVEPVSVVSFPSTYLEDLDIVFAEHAWIEPGECIDDVKVLRIDKTGQAAIQFEVAVFGPTKIVWCAPAAFTLIGPLTPQSSTSEDEQDQYEEQELVERGLRNVLQRAKRSRQAGEGRLSTLIEEIEKLLAGSDRGPRFISEGWRLRAEAEECLRSIHKRGVRRDGRTAS